MNQRLKQYKKIRIILSVLLVVILLIGTSFAIFQNFARQSGTNNLGATNCFSVTFEGVNNAINLANDYPIPDSEGLERNPYTFKITNNCNQYLTLSIGVETLSTSEIPSNLIKGVIIKNGGTPTSALLLSSGKTMEAQNGGTAYELLTDGLTANSSKTYDLRLWFDESMTKEQGASKKYQGKVIVGASASVSPTFAETILANNEVKTPLTTPGKEVSAHTLDDVESATVSVSSTYQAYYFTYGTGLEADGTKLNLTGASVTSDTYANSYSSLVGKYLPMSHSNFYITDFSASTAGTMKDTTNLYGVYYVVSATQNSFTYKVVSSNKNTTEALLASAEDDYGTSYYFRGAVKNNYVEFANKCWRIVRIVGDGSVKLVLHNDNTSKAANPCSSANNSTNAAFARYSGTTYKSKFNDIDSDEDNAYVGFMYGDFTIGCNDHPEITTENVCHLYGYTWGTSSYTEVHANINKSTILKNLETWYINNLAPYESKLVDTIWCNDKSTVNGGLGYGKNMTDYAAANRLVLNKTPTFICPNDNNGGKLSKFTVSDTTNGNGNLNYKIGLLTADEVAYAGYVNRVFNCSTYLQENATDEEWWTLSPRYFTGNGPSVFVVKSGLLDWNYSLGNPWGFRPAISLVSSIKVTGEGTSENPYKVV